jgi:hypothetical protein
MAHGFGLPFSSIHPNVHDQSKSHHLVLDHLARFFHVILVREVEGSIVDVQKVKSSNVLPPFA